MILLINGERMYCLQKTKELSSFYLREKARNRYHSQCKQCYSDKRKLFAKEHYNKYGDAYRKRARIRKASIKQDRQDKMIKYLSDKSCANCGINDIRVLDFDHIDETKKSFSIARAINDGYSWERISKEIKKCRILCANCHRIRTAKQYNWRKWRLGRVVRQDSAKVRTPVQIR